MDKVTDDYETVIVTRKDNNQQISLSKIGSGYEMIFSLLYSYYLSKQNGKNMIILIDEPELSMHPKWQQKVLQYYRNLFNKNGSQNVQMLIATHSEYVLRSALEDRDNVLIVVLSDDNGTIHSKISLSLISYPSVPLTISALPLQKF